MKPKAIISAFGYSLVVALLSCNQTKSIQPPAAATAQYPLIVRLESRRYSIAISAGPRCPVYSISNSTGQMLAQNLSLDDLRLQRPELYALLAPAMAPTASARVDERAAILSADVW